MSGGSPSGIVLAAGRYRLYLVADGAPVTVKIGLPGLSGGNSVIHTGAARRSPIYTPAPAVIEPTITAPLGMGGNRYSAGQMHSAPYGGVYDLVRWKLFDVGPPKSASQVGACAYRDRVDAGSAGPYEYPCGDAATALDLEVAGQQGTGRTSGPFGALGQYETDAETFGVLGAGTWGLGGYINSALPATEAHTQLFWLDFSGS